MCSMACGKVAGEFLSSLEPVCCKRMVLCAPEPIFIKRTTGQAWTLQQRQHSLQSADRDVNVQALRFV